MRHFKGIFTRYITLRMRQTCSLTLIYSTFLNSIGTDKKNWFLIVLVIKVWSTRPIIKISLRLILESSSRQEPYCFHVVKCPFKLLMHFNDMDLSPRHKAPLPWKLIESNIYLQCPHDLMRLAAVAMRVCVMMQATPQVTVAARRDSAEENEKVSFTIFSVHFSFVLIYSWQQASFLYFPLCQLQRHPELQLMKGAFLSGSYGRSRSASPGSGSRIRKYSPRRWFSRKSLEPVQIKVYEVDDMERVQKAIDPNFQVEIVTTTVFFGE